MILGLAGSCDIAFSLCFAISQTSEKAKSKNLLVRSRPVFSRAGGVRSHEVAREILGPSRCLLGYGRLPNMIFECWQ